MDTQLRTCLLRQSRVSFGMKYVFALTSLSNIYRFVYLRMHRFEDEDENKEGRWEKFK